MKILSLRQPWVWMVLHLGKAIENRKRPLLGAYRGPILLHASAAKGARDEARYYDEARAWVLAVFGAAAANRIPAPADWAQGGIVGRARVVDVLEPDLLFRGLSAVVDTRWWMQSQFGYVLADVEPLIFHTWKGSLGPQDAPTSLVELLEVE